MLSQTSPIGLNPGVSIPSQDLEKALQPFLDKLQKDFADMLAALVQDLIEDAQAGRSSSGTNPTAPAAPVSPAGQTPPSEPSSASSPDVISVPAPSSQPPDPPYGNGLWSDIYAYDVDIPQQGIHAGQVALGTNVPNWVGLDDPTGVIDPARIPSWDGNTPPGVPINAVPFYTASGSLGWLASNGTVWDTAGYIRDNTFGYAVADTNGLSLANAMAAVQTSVSQAGRPLTLGEVRALSVDYSGAPQDPYPLYFESHGARQAQAALALRNSPYGFSQGKIVPGTSLPAWYDTAANAALPAWDGRVPTGLPAGSVPFYKVTGALAFLGMDGKVYDPQGHIQDTVLAGSISSRLGMSQTDFLSQMHDSSELIGRPLTMSEVYAGVAKFGVPPVSVTI